MLHRLAAKLLPSHGNRGFAFTVVATLALGLAPNCVIFAIMDAIYFRPLPYPAQPRLALVNLANRTKGTLDELDSLTFTEVQRRATSFDSVAAYRNASITLNAGDRPERMPGQLVTADFFRTLGVLPSLGRSFRADECRPNGPRVVVISDRTWKEYFAARADIIGQPVRVDGVPSTVVGVMPAGFTSFMEGRTASVWAPMPLDEAGVAPGGRAGNAIARLKSGSSVDQARLELDAAHQSLARQFGEFYRDRRPAVRDFRSALFGGLGPGIRMLAVIVGLLLFIACGNAANLLLGRSAGRAREMAVRTALGARRRQLIAAMLTESLVLAAGANLLGLLVTYWGIRALWAGTAPMFRVIGVEAIRFDHRLLIFSALLTLLTTLLFGVLPALRGTRADIAGVLAVGSAASGRRRRGTMSRALVVSQVVLSVVTMVVATLVVRSFLHVSQLAASPGFRPQGVLVGALPQTGDVSSRPAARLDLVEQTEARIAALPGIARVAVADRVPFLEGGTPTVLSRRGAGAKEQAAERLDADLRVVDGDFFAVMSIPLLQGRVFGTTDNRTSEPVVVIGDRMARAYWPGANPLGDRLLVNDTWRRIIGVVGSTIQPSPFRPSAREAFVPYVQWEPIDVQLLVQSHLPVASLASQLRKEVRAVDPDQPVADLRTLERALDDMMTPFRLILVLMIVFGTIALALSAVGLYGVIGHDVSRRTREFGVRIAVGAATADVVRLVLRDGLRVAGLGLALGLLLGLALAAILPSQLFSAQRLSVYHYAVIASVWLAIAVVASLVPARRAAAVDPIVALRYE